MTDTSTSADFGSLADSADTSTESAPSQADSFDEGDNDYESLPDYGDVNELDEGDADYASLPDHSAPDDLDPELSYDELPDPEQTADPSNEPRTWTEGETVRPQGDSTATTGSTPSDSPEVAAARAGVGQALDAGEQQQAAREAVEGAYAQPKTDGAPPNTSDSFKAHAQREIEEGPSATGAKEIEFKEPGPPKEVEFKEPVPSEEIAATSEAIPEQSDPAPQDGLGPQQGAEVGLPDGVPDRSDSSGGAAPASLGDARAGHSDDGNTNDIAIEVPDVLKQGDASAHSDASDAATFDSQVDACVRAADEVGASKEAWDGMTVDERADVLRALEASMADATGRPGANVSFESLPSDTWGYFDPNTNDMVINADKLADPENFGELVDTVAHEGRHAYQDFALQNPAVHGDAEQLSRWADNATPGGYIDPNLDPEGYRYQPLEADAWDFGARVRAGIEEGK